MEFTRRIAAQLVLARRLQELYGAGFEEFFHRLMERLRPGWAPVRAAGGARGAEGLLLYDGTLYVPHAPAVPDPGRLRSALRAALHTVAGQGGDQFDTLVFVHNDARGGSDHEGLDGLADDAGEVALELWDAARLVREFRALGPAEAVELLGEEGEEGGTAEEETYGLEPAVLAPLLAGLPRDRPRGPRSAPVHPVSPHKLAYNALPEELRAAVREATRHSHHLDTYYAHARAVDEHDAVARELTAVYGELKDSAEDPEELWLGLTEHVLGALPATPERVRHATVVLAHFVERCDLLEAPPEGWVPRRAGTGVRRSTGVRGPR